MGKGYFAIARAVETSRERLFRAWTAPSEVGCWYQGAPFVYRELDEPARIVLTIGSELAIVTLSEMGDHTVMTFEASAREAETAERGWRSLIDRLVDQVSQSCGNAGGMRPG